jgi:hypothetical protein
VARELQTFLAQVEQRGGAGLPGFVRRELAALLSCGIMARGFARVRCTSCGDDLLVAFSCKGRGICPSCGGRRMADTAAHLVDRVLPRFPVRQWVLSLPFSLRFVVAFDRELCRQVRTAFMDGVLAVMRRRARRQGIRAGQSGAVVFVQRFGGALNLNVHFHALVLDGVFHDQELLAEGGGEQPPTFRVAQRLRGGELADVLQTIEAKIGGLLRRRQLDEQAAQEDLAARSPELAAAQAASIQGRLAFGPCRGQRVTRVGQGPGAAFTQVSRPDCAAHDGFSLHAGVSVAGTDREGLERLCRYVARPAIATERLSELPDGRIAYELRHPWSDGTTRVVFEPQTLLEKLAALIPPPRAHLVTYHGVLAPAAAMRSRVVPAGRSAGRRGRSGSGTGSGAGGASLRYPWAELLKRVFAVDVLRCHLCGGRREVLALVTEGPVVRAILECLGLPADGAVIHPARGPPELF